MSAKNIRFNRLQKSFFIKIFTVLLRKNSSPAFTGDEILGKIHWHMHPWEPNGAPMEPGGAYETDETQQNNETKHGSIAQGGAGGDLTARGKIKQ